MGSSGIDISTDTSTKPPSPSSSNLIENSNVSTSKNTTNFSNNFSKNTTNFNRNQPQAYIIQQKTTTFVPVCQPPTYENSTRNNTQNFTQNPLKRKLETLPSSINNLPTLPTSSDNQFKLETPPTKIKRESSTKSPKKPKEKKFACTHIIKETGITCD